MKWQEFLPWVGAMLTTLLLMVGSPVWWTPVVVYGIALFLGGLHQMVVQRSGSAVLGVPLCLLMLHTSFSIGLVDGLIRKGRLSNDRA